MDTEGKWHARPGAQPGMYVVAKEEPGWIRFAGPGYTLPWLAEERARLENALDELNELESAHSGRSLWELLGGSPIQSFRVGF